MAKIALVDDHVLIRRGLAALVRNLGHEVVIESDNGLKFMEAMNPATVPDVVLLDIKMPDMDGFQTALWLKQEYPQVKVLVISMYNDEDSVIGMLRCGARGYVFKNTEPEILKAAIEEVMEKGFYHSNTVYESMVRPVEDPHNREEGEAHDIPLTPKEMEFLKQICSELTYKEIAARMSLSPRTLDSYRDILFEKLNIRSRVGLVLYAIRHGIVKI